MSTVAEIKVVFHRERSAKCKSRIFHLPVGEIPFFATPFAPVAQMDRAVVS
jgi:hypothetical protein